MNAAEAREKAADQLRKEENEARKRAWQKIVSATETFLGELPNRIETNLTVGFVWQAFRTEARELLLNMEMIDEWAAKNGYTVHYSRDFRVNPGREGAFRDVVVIEWLDGSWEEEVQRRETQHRTSMDNRGWGTTPRRWSL